MPRYHFHVRDGVDMPDSTGTMLPDLASARSEALRRAGQMIGDAGMRGDLGEDWSVTVTDDVGLSLFVMTFFVAESPAVETR